MITIKNRTNSPYDLPTTAGLARLPAFGEVSRPTADEPGEFEPAYVDILEASMVVEVIRDATPSAEPVGNWQNGKPVTAKKEKATKEVDPELAKLRQDYKELTGKKFFHKWDVAELQKRIDAALAG
ncbi:hypothetical protein WYI_14012 [Ochrobactrum sp. CDB2]|nr:hypothetical protein WYI_14012 [Ochrobactrum sp. CDB2]